MEKMGAARLSGLADAVGNGLPGWLVCVQSTMASAVPVDALA